MPNICLLLVTCTCLAASIRQSRAIRVDWGTNQGPIVPPTPRTTTPPRLPYREPAPVWEDQSHDTPNPNPYVYVLPPPSRPRTWPIPLGPYADRDSSSYRLQTNYGTLIAPQQAHYNGGGGGTLAAQYVPGLGIKYTAVVPKPANGNGYYAGITDKLQGKYNAKTKKYKAYEKAKYAPLNYYRMFDANSQYVPQLAATEQQLPLETKPLHWQQPSNSSSTTTTATTPTTTTTTQLPTTRLIGNYKLAHEKSSYAKQLQLKKKQQQAELKAPNALHGNSNAKTKS